MKETPINTVNKLAKKLRHARSLQKHEEETSKEKDLVQESVAHVSHVVYMRPLKIKIIVCSIIALFFSTNIVSNAFFQDEFVDFTFLDAQDEFVEFQPTSESGFLKKPSIQTEKGKRTGVSDILIYTVQSGDTVSEIAARYNVSVGTILVANDIDSRAKIKSGTELIIPPVDGKVYKVKKDDTLDTIAKEFKVDKKMIMEQNNLTEETLAVNKEIIIPGAKIIVKEPPRPTPVYASSYVSGGSSRAPAYVAPPNNVGFVWPVQGRGRITQRYSYRHNAVDITYPSGNMYPNILAAESGVVVEAKRSGWNNGYGNVIVLDHGNGVKTRYAHNSTVYVSVGQSVRRGQVIAVMGRTGRVYGRTGIHVHFEVIIKGARRNPLAYY